MAQKIGKYEIQAHLARGGFGQVLRAYDPIVGRLVAIKVMASEADKDMLARFRQEAAAAGNLHHKNIVTIYEFGEHEGAPFLAMEFLEGQNLQEVIASNRALTLIQKVDIMAQVAEGLECAHRNGVVHRDVKPANVMLLPDGSVKIMDFGIARLESSGAARLTQKGDIIGTLRYMSPEQFQVAEVDKLSDIFAYGVIYYELLTYHHPFPAPDAASLMYQITRADPAPIRAVAPECTDTLERIVFRALAKDRDIRYQSLEDLLLDTNAVSIELRQQRAAEILADARAAFQSGNLEAARQRVREILELDPTNSGARDLRASIQDQAQKSNIRSKVQNLVADGARLVEQGKFADAIQTLESAERLEPSSLTVRQQLTTAREQLERSRRVAQLLATARSAFDRQDLPAALQNASEVVEIDPRNDEAHRLVQTARAEIERRDREKRLKDQMAKARGLVLIGEADQAISILTDLQTQFPESSPVGEMLNNARAKKREQDRKELVKGEIAAARDRMSAGDIEGAFERLTGALDQFPGEHELLGLLRTVREELEVRRRAEHIEATKARAGKLSQEGDFAGAAAVLEQGLVTHPNDASLLALLQTALSAKAAEDRRRTIADTMEGAERLQASGRAEDALRLVDASLAEFADAAELIDLRAALRKQWDERKRLEAIQKVVDRAQGLLAEGNSNSALILLRQTLSHYPSDPALVSELSKVEEVLRQQQRLRAIEEIKSRVESSRQAHSFEVALVLLNKGLRDFPDEASFATLRDAVLADKAVYERDQAVSAARQECEWLRQQGQFQDALRAADEALAGFGEDPELREIRARAEYEWSQHMRGEAVQAALLKARNAFDSGRMADAIALLQKSLVEFPGDARLQTLLDAANAELRKEDARHDLAEQLARAAQHQQAGQWRQSMQILEDAQRRYPEAQEIGAAIKNLRDVIREEEKKAEVARQIRIIEGKLSGKSWTEALQLTQAATVSLGSQPVFEQLVERAQAGRAEQVEQRRLQIQAVTGSAAALERNGDVEGALAAVQNGQAQFPDSVDLAELAGRLNRKIREQELHKKVSAESAVIERHIAAAEWKTASEALRRARNQLGEHPSWKVLADRIQSGEAGEKAAQAKEIAAIIARAAEIEQQGDPESALGVLEAGMTRYKQSPELAAAAKPLRQSVDKQRRVAQAVGAIGNKLAAGDAAGALDLVRESRGKIGAHPEFDRLEQSAKEERQRQELDRALESVRKALSLDDPDGAARALDKVRATHPNDPDIAELDRQIAWKRNTRATSKQQLPQLVHVETKKDDTQPVTPVEPSRKGLWIGIAAAALVIAGGAVKFWPESGGSGKKGPGPVKPAPSIVTAGLPPGRIGSLYSHQMSATGGAPPYSWQMDGRLPPGLDGDNSGLIQGVPSQVGKYSFTAIARDSDTGSVSKPFTIVISPAPEAPGPEPRVLEPRIPEPKKVEPPRKDPLGKKAPEPEPKKIEEPRRPDPIPEVPKPPPAKPCNATLQDYGGSSSGKFSWIGPPGEALITNGKPDRGRIAGGGKLLPGVPARASISGSGTIVQRPGVGFGCWTQIRLRNDSSEEAMITVQWNTAEN